MNTQTKTASWVIREKDSGAVIMETFDKAKVDALNTEKYEAMPIQEHLASLNRVRFQQIANYLLQKHYGIHLNDTDLCNADTAALLVNRGQRPYQAVAEWANETDLVRIDKQGFYGVQSKDEITESDERAAIIKLGIW